MESKSFNILVKTNSYAGNFERELCAFLTGHIGECTVGEEFINPTIKNIFNGYIENMPDEHGCYRPVALNENNANDFVIFFTKKPTAEQLEIIEDRAKLFEKSRPYEYLTKDFKYLGFELIEVSLNKKSITV